MKRFFILASCILHSAFSINAQSWTADNGNGTFTDISKADEFLYQDYLNHEFMLLTLPYWGGQ